MRLIVEPNGVARWGVRRMRCALGRSGVTTEKREGDGATPAGVLPMRRVLYRPDRWPAPVSRLAARPISPGDGWCDDPGDTDYNLPVALPHRGRCERLWREDALYDLVCVLGWNDDPVVAGAGSAIFLHVARPDFGPTEGCIALARDDLVAVLVDAGPGDAALVMLG
jgi:L,D-peptidoglycan transpeptidase YkuD (ErfK/YbiS/YcfS/YnhG family)